MKDKDDVNKGTAAAIGRLLGNYKGNISRRLKTRWRKTELANENKEVRYERFIEWKAVVSLWKRFKALASKEEEGN